MARMFQARAKVDINTKIKKGFTITGETPFSKPDGRDIHHALEKQYGKDAAAFSDSLSKWEILSCAYKIWVRFNNGDCRIFDFATIIDKYPVFEPLKDIELLKNFRLADTLEWMDGKIDIAPEYLYEHGVIAYPNKEIESGCVAEDKNTFIQDPEITEITHSYAEVKQGKAKTNSISKLLSEL